MDIEVRTAFDTAEILDGMKRGDFEDIRQRSPETLIDGEEEMRTVPPPSNDLEERNMELVMVKEDHCGCREFSSSPASVPSPDEGTSTTPPTSPQYGSRIAEGKQGDSDDDHNHRDEERKHGILPPVGPSLHGGEKDIDMAGVSASSSSSSVCSSPLLPTSPPPAASYPSPRSSPPARSAPASSPVPICIPIPTDFCLPTALSTNSFGCLINRQRRHITALLSDLRSLPLLPATLPPSTSIPTPSSSATLLTAAISHLITLHTSLLDRNIHDMRTVLGENRFRRDISVHNFKQLHALRKAFHNVLQERVEAEEILGALKEFDRSEDAGTFCDEEDSGESGEDGGGIGQKDFRDIVSMLIDEMSIEGGIDRLDGGAIETLKIAAEGWTARRFFRM
jgi:hypothetical protein